MQAVKHILARADEAARRSVEVQTRAMSEAAQALFKAEIDPALQRLEPVPVSWTPRSTMSVIHGRPVRSLATNREPAGGG